MEEGEENYIFKVRVERHRDRVGALPGLGARCDGGRPHTPTCFRRPWVRDVCAALDTFVTDKQILALGLSI